MIFIQTSANDKFYSKTSLEKKKYIFFLIVPRRFSLAMSIHACGRFLLAVTHVFFNRQQWGTNYLEPWATRGAGLCGLLIR